MKTIPLTRNAAALVDDEDYEWLSQWKWMLSTNGCAQRGGWRSRRLERLGLWSQKRIHMHRLILIRQGISVLEHVDHINRNRLDNRRTNLRPADSYLNGVNQPLRQDNKTGFRGVFFVPALGRYVARINDDGKKKHLGVFDTAEEASEAHCLARRQMNLKKEIDLENTKAKRGI